MICNRQSRLRAVLLAAIVAAVAIVHGEGVRYGDATYIEPMLSLYDATRIGGGDFWLCVVSAHLSEEFFIEAGVYYEDNFHYVIESVEAHQGDLAGAEYFDARSDFFSKDSVEWNGTRRTGMSIGKIFLDPDESVYLAYKITDKTLGELYGWVQLKRNGNTLVVLNSALDLSGGVLVVGSVPRPGPDDIEVISEKPDNIILQWDFNSIHDRDSIYTVSGMDKHFIRGGDIHDETRTNFNGRSCVRLSTYKQCMAGWFSINNIGYWVQRYEAGYESWIEYVGEYHKPALYDTIGVALRLWADVPCTTTQAPHTEFPLNGVDWLRELDEYSETLPDMPEPPGAVIHVDDKMWLRYLASEDGVICKTNWQACVGMMDASSNIVERTVDLKAAVDGATLPSPVGAWTTVRIEAENAASPNGLGFRIWIGGVAAASTEGATVFYARPTAADRNGAAALAVGGNAYIDDLTFFKKHRNPLDDVDVNTWHGDLSESEADTLAAILGEESLPGLQFIDAQDWDSPSDDFAAINCIRLGITPAESDLKYTGDILTLKFKNPTVTITAVDFPAGNITAKVIPAEGTRVAVPPLPYMFGLTEVPNIGAGRMETTEYGDRFSLGEEGFSVDLTYYVTSNGVFTLHFPDWVAPSDKSLFFKVQLKEYSHK